MPANPSWKDISKKKLQEQHDRIPAEWRISPIPSDTRPIDAVNKYGILSIQEMEWTNPRHDIATIQQWIASGNITTEQLITAFCKRAAVAHQLTNCLTEIMFQEAIQRAKNLDQEFASTGQLVGPVHGIPIRVKGHLDVEGFDSTIGIASLCFDRANTTSQLVQILVNQGAIVIAKTNVPQTCLTADTDNRVFGRTLNAYNTEFSAGGSSGGEGSLVAMGGSVLGIGSDGAGSIRMPAAANGVVGYKPSGYRLPMDGRAILGHGVMGTTALGPVGVFGFLGRSMKDVRLAAKLVSDSKPWETSPFLYPSPWLGVDVPRPRIGVWLTNGFIHLHPPVQRGLLAAQDRLRKAGYDLAEFTGPDISKVWDLTKDWTEIQGLWRLREYLKDEPYTKSVIDTGIMQPKSPRPPLTLEYLHNMNMEFALLASQMAQAWRPNDQPLDALLWVTAPHTALPFDQWTDTTFTCIFNCADQPAVSLPLGIFSDKNEDTQHNVEPFNELDVKIQALYDPETFHGLPLSVQLIGKRFADEQLLAIAERLHPIVSGKGC